MQINPASVFSREDYALEEYERASEQTDFKLEYFEGRIIMSSATTNHGEIIANILIAATRSIRDCGCRLVGEAGEIRPPVLQGERTAVFEPDLTLYCPDGQARDARLIPNPLAVVEVLSPSTRDVDLGPKFERCARIPSLRHYVLIEKNEMRVEHRWRAAFGAAWQYRVLTEPDDRVTFAEVPFDLSLAEVYEDIPV